MKKRNNPNYLSTIKANHPPIPLGHISARSKRKNGRNRNPVNVAENIYKFSDGQQYMKFPNGQMVRVTEVKENAG